VLEVRCFAAWKIGCQVLEAIVSQFRSPSDPQLGTFTGYSALCFAAGLPHGGGKVITAEIDPEVSDCDGAFMHSSRGNSKHSTSVGLRCRLLPLRGSSSTSPSSGTRSTCNCSLPLKSSSRYGKRAR